MRERTIRALGASSILGLIALAVIFNPGPPETSAEVQAPVATSASSEAEPSTTTSSTTTTIPFHYRVGVLAAPSTSNFWAFYGGEATVWDAYVLGPTKPALYGLDPETSRLRPELVAGESAPVEDSDGWHVDVDLRTDMAWSDGTPITADDLVFTFTTVRELNLGGGWAEVFPAEVVSITATDADSVRIGFAARPPLAVWPHAVGTAPLMPAHIWNGHGALTAEDLYAMPATQDPGGGPLTLVELTGAGALSVANPGHPDPGPDQVEYVVYPDIESAVEAIREGAIDTILSPNGIRPDLIPALEGVPGVTLASSPANGVRYLGFNLEREPMSNPAFRKAVALLTETEADSFIGPHNQAWIDPPAAGDATAPDPAAALTEAIAGLEQSGYTWETRPALDGDQRIPGTGLRIGGVEAPILTILTPGDLYDPARPELAASVASVLGWLGFDARPVETDFETVVDLAFTPDENGVRHYDMVLGGWTLGSPALPSFYEVFFSRDGVGNNTGYASDGFEAALARYQAAFDHATARAALAEMEKVLATDLPYVLLSHTTIVEAYRSDRVAYGYEAVLGGIQGRLGGLGDVVPADSGATLGE